MKKITKAVITAAGLGTRMLPIAKSVSKVMLPIVDKPAIQYQVEEASKSGITDILIIIGRDNLIENHFDYSPEYELALKSKQNGEQILKNLTGIADLANIHYIRQKEPKGLGHAVLCAKSFVGDDNFMVIYGDDIIIGETPASRQLIDTYEKYGGEVCVAGVKKVEPDKLRMYCSLDVDAIKGSDDEFNIYDMNEKPNKPEDVFSDYAILGRVLLTPEIFDILENQDKGANGEIQLTDSMKTLVKKVQRNTGVNPKMIARVFEGERHDMGSKFGFLRANIIEGMKHPETGEALRAFLKEFAAEL